MPLTKLLRWLPLAILTLTGLVLLILWPKLPARWAVHIGPDGRANGWALKTPLSAAAPLLLGFFVWAFGEAVLWVRAGGTAPEEREFKTVSVRIICALSAGFVGLVALVLPLNPSGPPARFFPLVGFGFCFALLGGFVLAKGLSD